MTIDRFFDWSQLAVMAGMGCVGFGRALVLRVRGVHVVAVDSERTPAQMLADLILLMILLFWVYAAVAYAWPLPARPVPPSFDIPLVDAVAVKLVGVLILIAAAVLYGLALHAFGRSWRLGIDRKKPGPLVTDGIFAWTRNPVYLSLDLLVIGTFLVQERAILFVLALGFVSLLHEQILREERFLAATYGAAYRDYCARVDRYFTLRIAGEER